MARPTMLKICFVIAALSCIGAATSYAAGSSLITSSLLIGGGTYSPSNKVTIQVQVSGPAATCDPSNATNPCQMYAAKSKHGSGDRVIATNNLDPKVYYQTVNPSVATGTWTVSATESFTTATSWTASRIVAMSFCEPRS